MPHTSYEVETGKLSDYISGITLPEELVAHKHSGSSNCYIEESLSNASVQWRFRNWLCCMRRIVAIVDYRSISIYDPEYFVLIQNIVRAYEDQLKEVGNENFPEAFGKVKIPSFTVTLVINYQPTDPRKEKADE